MSGTLSRRTLLGTTAVLAAALSACDDVPLEQTRPGALDAAARPTPEADPDRDLLQAALLLEATQVARLERVLGLRLSEPVSRRLGAAREVHLAHVELLRGEDPAPTVAQPASAPRRLLDRLPATELTMAEQHASAALSARSGRFARVLGSLAAAARQQAVVLDGGNRP